MNTAKRIKTVGKWRDIWKKYLKKKNKREKELDLIYKIMIILKNLFAKRLH